MKFASPIPERQITSAIEYLENYKPSIDPIESDIIEEFTDAKEWTEHELNDHMENAAWQLTKTMIRTEDVERVLSLHKQMGIEPLILEAGSEQWTDAINALLAISAVVSNRQAEIFRESSEAAELDSEESVREKEWEWIDESDRRYVVRTTRNE